MTYILPSGGIDFELSLQYTPISHPSNLDFDLASGGGAGNGPNYRRPPDLMVSYGYAATGTSATVSGYTTQGTIDGHPVDMCRRQFASDGASVEIWTTSGGRWSKTVARDSEYGRFSGVEASSGMRRTCFSFDEVGSVDNPDGAGAQWWSIKPPKDRGWEQPTDYAPPRDAGTVQSARTSVLNWQPPPPQRIDLVQTETLNLQIKPYSPPGAMVVDFELVPDGIFVEIEPPTRSVDAMPALPGWSLKEALDGRTIHPWDRKPRLNTEVEFPHDAEPDPEPEPEEPPPEPEIKRAYLIMNASSIVEVSTGTPLEFQDLNLSLDIDSFSWAMTVTVLNRASMDLIRPSAAGPAEVDVTVNGYTWRMLIESYTVSGQFPTQTYTVKGVSRTQLLADPYAPKLTGRITAPTTRAQVMSQILMYTGFDVLPQSGLADFTIPAGAWGWVDKTAAAVLAELADAQGCVLVPDREQDRLHLRHRYKQVGPWDYDSQPAEFVDAIVQDTMTLSYTGQWEPQPEVNSVVVSGITDGVFVNVIRTGTAGDKAADDIFDDLNVDSTQCRDRGLTALASGGDQEIVTLEVPLPTSGAPGLIEPAQILEFRDSQDTSQSWRGMVLGVTVSVSKPGTARVVQTVKVERHHYS